MHTHHQMYISTMTISVNVVNADRVHDTGEEAITVSSSYNAVHQ